MLKAHEIQGRASERQCLPRGSLDVVSARRAIMVGKCVLAVSATLFGGLRSPLPGGRGQQVRFGRNLLAWLQNWPVLISTQEPLSHL